MTRDTTADEAARLHRVLTMFEVPARLDWDQRVHLACAWCREPLDEGAVDLGCAHGCADCYTVRLTWLASWNDWYTHVQNCPACGRNARCYVAQGRRIMHEQAIVAAAKPRMVCGCCGEPITPKALAVPVLWEGNSISTRGYAHVLCGRGASS